jgi:hypothetical protein
MVPLWWIIVAVAIFVAAGIGFFAAWKLKPATTGTKAADGKSQEEQNENSFWFGLTYAGAAAAAAILIPLLLCVGLQWIKHSLPVAETHADSLTNQSIVVTLVVIASVIGLLAVLMMTALAFSSVKLSDSTQALGLPEGSVRAVIALSLIVIFVIVVVFLFGNLRRDLSKIEHLTGEQIKAIGGDLIASKHREDPEYEAKKQEAAESQKQLEDLRKRGAPEGEVKPAEDKASKAAAAAADAKKKADEADPATKLYTVERFVEPSRGSEDLAKQIITTISTLVVSIAAFYFGSTTAISAAKSGTASGAPVITKQPNDLKVKVDEAAKFSVLATGANLSYQWQKTTGAETNDIPGATNNSHEIVKVTLADNGSKFSCKVTNLAGTTLSRAATLTVTAQA